MLLLALGTRQWRACGDLVFLAALMVVAGVALFALWLPIVRGPEWFSARRKWRAVVATSLVAGLIGVAMWLRKIDEPKPLLAFSLALAIPVALGCRYLVLLTAGHKTARG
jgi:uncharacterized membrane protein YdfJ with MMPL/SSD domain